MTEKSVDTIIICRPKSPYFCIGHHQNVQHVLDRDACSKLGYPVMRRRLGGGVTYLDDQQLFYQSIFHRSRSPAIPANVYRERLRQPINMLRKIGVEAELRYTNEVEVSGRRIAGIGGGLIGEASVVVGNVLNDFDFDTMTRIINAPCTAFREMALSAMLDRMTTLKREGREQFWKTLSDRLIEEYRLEFGNSVYVGELRSEEFEEASKQAERMASEEYLKEYQNDGRSRYMTRMKISASASIELVRTHSHGSSRPNLAVLKIKDNVIEERRKVDHFDVSDVNRELVSTLRLFEDEAIRVGKEIQPYE